MQVLSRVNGIMYISFWIQAFLPFINGFSVAPTRAGIASYQSSSILLSTQENGIQSGVHTEDMYRTMYEEPSSIRNGTLTLDGIHEMFFEVYGSDDARSGKTALVLHGGPGAASFPNHARFFDPKKYSSIILFDQRGCGKSLPRGEIRNNTLNHLVMDIEKLRFHLGVEVWDTILGGSWGCTLALAYAQTFPRRVAGLVLRGICLFRSEEINWLFGNDVERSSDFISTSSNAEELWKKFDGALIATPGVEESNPRSALHKYYNCLLGDDPLVRLHAARHWFGWEFGISSVQNYTEQKKALSTDSNHALVWLPGSGWSLEKRHQTGLSHPLDQDNADLFISKLRRWKEANTSDGETHTSDIEDNYIRKIDSRGPGVISKRHLDGTKNITVEEAEKIVPAQAMLTCYYSVNDKYMMKDYDILSKESIDKIRHIPCIGVQGGQDPICPPDTAFHLHSQWPEMELHVVLSGKHSMYDKPITSKIISATDRLGQLNDLHE